ncbi:MAG: hypothetical protein ACI4QE_02905, partial [Acutalibacteraceae bacterium]
YYVCGDSRNGRVKLNVSSFDSEVKVRIRKIPLPVFNTFLIFDDSELIRLVLVENFFRIQGYFHGISWRIRGDILSKNFDIVDADNTTVATLIRRWGRECDIYELTIFDKQRELFALASILSINSFNLSEKEALQTV